MRKMLFYLVLYVSVMGYARASEGKNWEKGWKWEDPNQFSQKIKGGKVSREIEFRQQLKDNERGVESLWLYSQDDANLGIDFRIKSEFKHLKKLQQALANRGTWRESGVIWFPHGFQYSRPVDQIDDIIKCLNIFCKHCFVSQRIIDNIIECTYVQDFRVTARSILSEVENLLEGNRTPEAFEKEILAKVKKVACKPKRNEVICDFIKDLPLEENVSIIFSLLKELDTSEPKRNEIICELIRSLSFEENASIIFSLFKELGAIIPTDVASKCLDMMLMKVPEKDLGILLLSKLSRFDVDPECSQKLERLYSVIYHSGGLGPVISELSDSSINELFPRMLYKAKEEKVSHRRELDKLKQELDKKDQEILRLKELLAKQETN